jgi:hypothetical protein
MSSECQKHLSVNRIGDVMVSVLASSVVDRGFEPRSGQTKDYQIGICCFSAKHATLRYFILITCTNNINKGSQAEL